MTLNQTGNLLREDGSGQRHDAVFFDFDGVLADSEAVHFRCWREILAPLEIELEWDDYVANCIGVSDVQMLGYLASLAPVPANGLPLTGDDLRPTYTKKKELFRIRASEADLFDSEVLSLIPRLNSYSLAVVTSSGRREVEPQLDRSGILPYLSAFVTGDDVKNFKPSPEPYLLAAERTGAKRPLVFEDSATGIQSATSAGFEYIRVIKPSDLAGLIREHLELSEAARQA